MDSQEQQYKQKLEGLKKDLPFLLSVLEKIRSNNLKDTGRQIQLEKMQKLFDLINDKTQILKWETLLKCESVVKKLQSKMEQHAELQCRKSGRESTLPLLAEKSDVIDKPSIMTTTSANAVKNVDEIPAPESPPPQYESDIEVLPVEIPTERRNSPPAIYMRRESDQTEHRQHTHHRHRHHHYHQQHHHQKQHHHRRRDSNHAETSVKYSPENACDSIRSNSKHSLQKMKSSNESATDKRHKKKQSEVITSQGHKISENATETSQFNVRRDQSVYESSLASSKLKLITISKDGSSPPTVSVDLLNKPPLSANDISKLLIETNTNSNSNSNSFDNEFIKHSSSTVHSTSSKPSTFELIRKKFALLTKGNSLPPDIDVPNTATTIVEHSAPKHNQHPRLSTSTKVVDSTANVLPTLRPNDPRLRRSTGVFNNTPPSLPQTTHKPSPSNILSNQMPTVVSKQMLPTTSLPVPQPVQVLQRNLGEKLYPMQNKTEFPPYKATLGNMPCDATINPTPPPLMSIDFTNARLTRYCDSSNGDWDKGNIPPEIIDLSSPLTSLSTANATIKNSSINKSKEFSSDVCFKRGTETTFVRYCDSSDENWDTDDNACDYATTRSTKSMSSTQNTSSQNGFPDQLHWNKRANPSMQRRNSAATAPFCQRRNLISSNEASQPNEQSEFFSNSNMSNKNPFKHSLANRLQSFHADASHPNEHTAFSPAISNSGATDYPFQRSLPKKLQSLYSDLSHLSEVSPVISNSSVIENPFKRSLHKSFHMQTTSDLSTQRNFRDGRSTKNDNDANEIQRNLKIAPPRRKSLSWENYTQNNLHNSNNRFNNSPTMRPNDSPNFSNSSIDRFHAKLNDSVERTKYLESKKQKEILQTTYGAYKEARARAAAEAEAQMVVGAKLLADVVESPISNTTTPAPIANTTLDNFYRSTNLKSCELPKANIGGFKIPKKQTIGEETKNKDERTVNVETPKKDEKTEEYFHKREDGTKDIKNKDVIKEEPKLQNIQKLEGNTKNSKEQASKANKTDKMNIKQLHISVKTTMKSQTKQLPEKKIEISETKNLSQEKLKIKNKELPEKDTNSEEKTTTVNTLNFNVEDEDMDKTKTEGSLQPKQQRDCFKDRKTQSKQLNEKQTINTTRVYRDPRLEKKSKPTLSPENIYSKIILNTTNKVNMLPEDEKESNCRLESEKAADEINNLNNTDEQTKDKVPCSNFEEDNKTTNTREKNESNNARYPGSPQKQFEDFLNSPIKPRRILTRRCTMVEKASTPEVDKEKLAKANAMLFEDLQEQQRRKKKAAESSKTCNRRYNGEICYEKTDDNCTVSTQNILSGKRRTRTTVNFNEVQQSIAVFKHLKTSASKKAVETEKKNELKNVKTPPGVAKTRQKLGAKQKQKSVENEAQNILVDETSRRTQTPPPTTNKPKPIRKRRQTFVEPKSQEEPQGKRSKEVDEKLIEDEATALPNVANIFDNFIQKLLNPDTNAEELIKKLRDILNENEVQTLIDVRAAMSKKQQGDPVTAAEKAIEAPQKTVTNENVLIEIPNTSSRCASPKIESNSKKNCSVKTLALQSTAKNKPYKTELDRLHDDIRDMFISEGVLTATGRRMSKFVKPTTRSSTPEAKTKVDNGVALKIEKSHTTTNNEAENISLPPTRKTRSAVAGPVSIPAAKSFGPKSVRNLRKKQWPHEDQQEDLHDTRIWDDSMEDLSTNSDATSVSAKFATNLEADFSVTLAALHDVPNLRPVQLLEVDEHTPFNKKKEITSTTTPIASPIPEEASEKTSTVKTKQIPAKKRRKPCPKSKKPLIDSTDEDDGFDDDENMTLMKIKQEMLDIVVPYEEPNQLSQKYKNPNNKTEQNDLKNINPKWHSQSRYAHKCAVCGKRGPHIAMHYKKFHRENYSSRLPPSILHQLKTDNESLSKPILKFARPNAKQNTYHWLHRCPFCLQFKRTVFKSWMEHFISHTGEHCYECTLCHLSCNQLNVIEKHLQDRCGQLGGRYLHNDEVVVNSKIAKISAHICHLCNFLRLGRSGLDRHFVEQHGYNVKEAKNLGYTIVLMDFENVPFIDTLGEALEVEDKLGSQFNGQLVDLNEIECGNKPEIEEATKNNEETKNHKCFTKEKETLPQNPTILGQEENKQGQIKENSVVKKQQVKSTTENESDHEQLLRPMPKCKKNAMKKDNEKKAAEVNEETTTKQLSSKSKETTTEEFFTQNTAKNAPSKITVSNAFMSTTDDSNEEEAASSKLLVKKLFRTNDEVEVSANSEQKNRLTTNSITMAERLSQRLKEAEEKAISPTKQTQKQQLEKARSLEPSAETTLLTPAALVDREHIENEVNMNDCTIEIVGEDEEDDGWEDIEIVETAPSANSSLTSHSSSFIGKDSKANKSKMNSLQKISRFITSPNALKTRRKNNKGLKSLMTLLSDNISNESDNAEATNERANIKSQEFPIKSSTTTKNNQTVDEMATTSTTTPTVTPTTNSKTSTIISTKTPALGFRPWITNIVDLLPDSSSNDPLELVPELRPSSPLQDLNDLTSLLGENLNGIMDIDLNAASNTVCIHSLDNRETSIQEALDFVTSQPESFESVPDKNKSADLQAVTAPMIMNRVQNIGFHCAILNNESNNSTPIYKFYCLSDHCTFLFSSEAIGLQNHFLFEHPQTKWNGYCETCAAQIKFVTFDVEFSYTEELEHLLEVHIKQKTQDENFTNIAENENTKNEQAPRIKLRRLSGDCLSTTPNSNSSSNTGLISVLEDSSLSDLIRFNPLRPNNLSSEESQSTTENASDEIPIEISCVSNDGSQPLFKNVSSDFKITSISSGLEPNEFSEIIKNANQQQQATKLSSNVQQTPHPLQITNVVSLKETATNADFKPLTQIPQPKINIVLKASNQPLSVLKNLLQTNSNTENSTASNKSTFETNQPRTDIEAQNQQIVQMTNNKDSSTLLPKITNVCSLSNNQARNSIELLWSQQTESERNELTAGYVDTAPRVENSPTLLSKSPLPTVRPDSPEPLIVSETVPVAQATTGNFVITQTVSTQYKESNDLIDSNNVVKPTVDFNISISAADFNLANTAHPSTAAFPISTTITSLTTNKEEQKQEQSTSKLPALKCLERTCNFNARHFVSMINHIKMHDLKKDSTKHEYLRCSICRHKALTVDDYTNHIRAQHFPVPPKSSVSSTTSDILKLMSSPVPTSNALTEKIRNILNGKQGDISAGSSTTLSSNNAESSKNSEDISFKEQLHDTLKNMVAKTGLPENKLLRCLVNNCNVRLNEENYHTHTLYHLSTVGHVDKGPYTCPHCKKKNHTITTLKKHMKDHARHSFFCYICLETAPSIEKMSRHYAQQHNFKKNLHSHELLKNENSSGEASVVYYVAHMCQLSTDNIHDFGKKLIIEWQRKKAATRTHFKPNEVDLLPMQAIFSRDIFCGVCEYKSKVRTNMLRHLLQHKADANVNAANTGSSQASGLASTANRTVMDPVNPVPCLISNEKHFDRMTNLASSSHGTAQPLTNNAPAATATAPAPATDTNTTTANDSSSGVEQKCKLRYSFVSETKRFICGVVGCQYLTISEDIFRSHLVTLHGDARTYHCPLCGDIVCKKTFSSERIIQHLRYHDRTMFQCGYCEYNHYMRYLVEKHLGEKHNNIVRPNLLVFRRNENQPLEGVRSAVVTFGKKNKEAKSTGSPATETTNNVPFTQNINTPASSSKVSLAKKHKISAEKNPRPLWQRDDPTRVRQIRGIPMEDEADSERLRKRLRLTEDYYDDEEDGNEATAISNDAICKLYQNCFEFGCFHCETKTLKLQDLRTHWHQTHSAASNCGATKPFKFRLLKQLKCAECRTFFGCHWEIRKHLKLAHKRNSFFAADVRTKQLVCGFCDYEGASVLQLQRHSQRLDHAAHDIKDLTAIQMVQTMRLESDDDPASLPLVFVQCLLCNELFCSNQEVSKHAREKHDVDIERFSFKEFKNTIFYCCSDCNFASAEELATLRHMINHYAPFKSCHFCSAPQTTFNGYMQHCYSDHRTEIRRFSEIYPLHHVRRFLQQMLVLFPNGWVVEKKNLHDTPYGSGERIKQFYIEICRTSQEPPIPRLSLGRLVARKSIEAKQQQQPTEESSSSSTAAAMQLAGNENSQMQKQRSVALKISKRRSTVAIGNDMAGASKSHQTYNAAKRQKLATHIVENRQKVTMKMPPKFCDPATSNVLSKSADIDVADKPFSFYGKRPDKEETNKIFTNISFAGVNTRISLDKFKILVKLDAHVVLEKLNIEKLYAAKNVSKGPTTDECEVGSSSGNLTYAQLDNQYAHVKKACPASQKYKFA